jgi:hypothetical protein
MPYVDGRQVAGFVKAASPSTPVIPLTGWGHRLMIGSAGSSAAIETAIIAGAEFRCSLDDSRPRNASWRFVNTRARQA